MSAVVAGAVLLACGSEPGDPAAAGTATVVSVIDGDTVVVELDGRDEPVRLLGVDTPETVHPDRDPECFGAEASAFTAALLPPGTPVRLERDVVGRDHYGRVLGYVHRMADDLFVNEMLVRRGYAVPLHIEPNGAYVRRFVDAARAAEADDLGLWAACGG